MTTIRDRLNQKARAIEAAQRGRFLFWAGLIFLSIILPLHFMGLLFTKYSWAFAIVAGIGIVVCGIPWFLRTRLRCPVCLAAIKQYGEGIHFCLSCGANFDAPK